MYSIGYEQNKIFLSFLDVLYDEFIGEVNYLKSKWLKFDSSYQKWVIPNNRFEEIILWFEKDKKEYYLEDSCIDYLKTITENYKKESQFFRDRKFNFSILNDGVELKEYQKKYINWRLQRNVYLDAHDTGTGKTISNICVFSQLYKQGLVDGIIILVPIGLAFNWKEEILNKVNVFKEEDIEIITNETKFQPFEKYKDKKILIIRHDLYATVIASYRKDFKPSQALGKIKWNNRPFINIKTVWNKQNIFFCIDECDAFKNKSSLKTKAIFNTKQYYDYKSLISATPWINGIEDSYSPLTFLDHSIIPMTENAFKLWLAKDIGNRYDPMAIREYNVKNVQTVIKSYQHIFTQVLKEDLDEIKTTKIYKDIKFELLPEQMILYHRITEEVIRILQGEYDKITWKLLEQKLHLILEVFDNPLLLKKRHYDNEVINNIVNKWTIEKDQKFIYLKNKIEKYVENKKKLIIYDIHPDTLDILAEKFKDYNPLVIHGNLKITNKEKDRKEKEDLFNFNKDYKLFFLSAFTSARGLNLQYSSNSIIWYTLPFDATPVKQGSERTDRVTSIDNSLIEYFYYPYTIDALRYYKAMNRLEMNRNMDKVLSQDDLHRFLNGSTNF